MNYNLNSKDKEWLEDTYNKLLTKMRAECERVGSKIPYISENGVYKEDKAETEVIWWTNGFWPGILWQMYNATGDEIYRITAQEVEEKLDNALEEFAGLNHDVGFMWLHSAIANYRLTGNERSRDRGLHAAHILAGRYNPRGKFIKSWNKDNESWIIVDSLMNVPILYWASDVSGDPSFTFIGTDHVDTVCEKVIREDGSSNHILILDPNTGAVIDNPAGQGYESGSSWTRGQSWALHGLTLNYKYTKNPLYLEKAQQVAEYFINEVKNTDYIPPIDFKAPKTPEYWDTTAGVCAASGLLELAIYVDPEKSKYYTQEAINILKAIDEKYCNWDKDYDSIVQMGSGAYSSDEDRHVPIIYGDYFFIEALLKLKEKDLEIWC